ncbi:proepiregulin [Crocuta crocuta]
MTSGQSPATPPPGPIMKLWALCTSPRYRVWLSFLARWRAGGSLLELQVPRNENAVLASEELEGHGRVLALCCHLLQAVLGTTVIPSCIPGESEDNCTALVQTEDNPRVAQVSITKCGSDMNGYCLHGQCIYLVDMSENSCRCEVGYTGVRCEHFFLTVQQPLSKEYVALTVILIILFLIIVAGSIYYFCRWYRNQKSKEPKKEYERVTSGDPALPQV